MLRYIAGILVVIGLVLASLYFFVGVSRVYREDSPLARIPHLYENADQSIQEINIAAFYFVPNNKVGVQIENWHDVLDRHLEALAVFHYDQFLGRSGLRYMIYPEPIIGLEESSSYDTEVVDHGNPKALRKIAAELTERVFTATGDRYQSDFAAAPESSYRTIVIMYEGVGATGSDNVALLARTFLTGREYRRFGTTFLAHEFYHALGIPDGYDTSKRVYEDGQKVSLEILKSGDLMGRVRIPIENTYLDTETLRKMGL